MKVFVVGYSTNYVDFLDDAILVDTIPEADVVLFTGGSDVSPDIYNCQKHPTTWNDPRRDEIELGVFNSIPKSKLVVGICRGSQFLCAVNGGILVQDCHGHAIGGQHSIINKDGVEYSITSTHHQMQFPYLLPEKDYDLLYWSTKTLSDIHEGFYSEGKLNPLWRENKYKEAEIVLYHNDKNPRCLGIQGHPEMMEKNCDTVKMLNTLIKDLLK